MTGPGGGGVGGFEYSDDSVVAKVSVEVSSQDLDNLYQLTTKTEQLRVGLEAVARAQGDFGNYLQQLPEIQQKATAAQQAYLDVLKQSVEMQERLRVAAGSLGPPGTAAGSGQPDPFAGATAGMGGVTPGGGAVPQSLQQAQAQLGQLRQDDMRAYASWQQAHMMPTDRQTLSALYPSLQQQQQQAEQHVQNRERQRSGSPSAPQGQPDRPGDSSSAGQFKDMASGMADAAQMVLNENGPGGSLLRMASRGMRSASDALARRGHGQSTGDDAPASPGGGQGRGTGLLDDLGGGVLDGLGLKGVGGIAKGLGMGSAVLGGGLALNRIVQNAGEEYQQYKNLGMMRGGGAAEGYGYEMQARIMALNPFISTEQSRQVIQAALRDGYTGKEFDTVTDFIANNLKNMNMDVSESVQVLRKSIETGGQSIQGFTAQMETLKESSKTGVRTYDDMKAAVEANTSTYVDRGMSGGAAGQLAAANAQAFKDNRVLADVGDRFLAGVARDDTYLARVGAAANLTDVMPGEVPYADPNFNKDVWVPLIQLAKEVQRMDPRHAVDFFRTQANIMVPGLNLTYPEAQQLLQYLQTQNPGEVGAAENAKAAAAATKKSRFTRSGNILSAAGKEAGTVAGAFDTVARDVLDPRKWGNVWGDIKAIPGKVADAEAEAKYKSGDYDIPVLNKAINKYGARNVEIVDKGGRVLNLNDESTVKRLQSGEAGWRQKGTNDFTTLADTAGALRSSGAQGVQMTGQITITLDPAAQRAGFRAPGSLTLTQNQLQAGAGWRDATMNSAPPGDR